jgi:hypothetical protein
VSGASPGWRLRRSLLPLIAFSLVAALVSGSPAVAHTFTKSDGNDSKGRLDLRSVTVSHTSNGVMYAFKTFEGWKPRMLGPDSFFLVQIDWNKDRRYERCAFIFFGGGKLRGSLSNCGRNFIQGLKVSKPSGTVAKISIPKGQLHGAYWWASASVWTGPVPCANGCLDFAPNNFPDILHDLTPPVVTLDSTPLRVWESSTSTTFDFPFRATDSPAGMKSWKVQSQLAGGTTWTTEASGSGEGSKDPSVDAPAGRFAFRVVATDKQGNTAIDSRPVYVPIDDTEAPVSGEFSVAPVPTFDGTAFGGSVSTMAMTNTFTHTTDASVCLFELIASGDGSWDISVAVDAGPATQILAMNVPDGPRQTIFSDTNCGAQYVVTVNSLTFPLDAVLG